MATPDQSEEKGGAMENLTSYSHGDDLGDEDHTHESYIHNPEEFIDIHGSDPFLKHHNVERDVQQCTGSVHDTSDNIHPDSSVSALHDNSDCSHSQSQHGCIQNLRVPVQVSEESDIRENCDIKQKGSDNSDDDYQSADDGDGSCNKAKVDDEEDGSDDDFIPVGDENNDDGDCGACGDHRGAFDVPEECCAQDEGSGDENEEEEKEKEIIDDEEVRKKLEEALTEDEKQERKNQGQHLKDEGNTKFRNGEFDEAITLYTQALEVCPLNFHKERSIMFSNRAACKMRKEQFEEAIKDSSSALELHPHYLKALLRRAELYEKTEKLDEALADYQKIVELDPSQHLARATCVKLAEQIKERNEKMKDEMIGKLKDLGNMVLRPFGLSVNNFQLQQDPGTGSYSVQFQQSPPNNGS